MCELREIYSLARLRKDFDEIPVEELKEMVGWNEPEEFDQWSVPQMFKGEFMMVDTQTEATILAGIEEIKALFIKKEETK